MKSPELNLQNSSPKLAIDMIPRAYADAFEKAEPLSTSFYLQDTVEVARSLLGKGLFLKQGKQILLCEVVEVEAYLGRLDPASHAYRGMTKRNWPMFERGGTCYVYFSYGAHYCMNVATQEKGIGEAILFRALAPLFGVEKMKKNRSVASRPIANLTNGPGRLTAALGIDLSFNGLTFDEPRFKILDLGKKISKKEIGKSPRIGISQAKEWELRFFLKSSPWLSRRLSSNE